MTKEQEGPVNGMIPSIMYKTCQGCKHYSHRLVKSGNNPIYRQDCKLDIAPRAGMLSMSGNLKPNEFIRRGIIGVMKIYF